jgi:hypothetical protein
VGSGRAAAPGDDYPDERRAVLAAQVVRSLLTSGGSMAAGLCDRAPQHNRTGATTTHWFAGVQTGFERESFMRLPRILLCPLLAFAFAVPSPADAGRFDFVPAASAGPSGTTAAPDLLVRFTGDGVALDSQADYTFDGGRLELSPSGIGGALCSVIPGNRLRVIAPVRLTPFPTTTMDFCTVRVSIRVGAAQGTTAIEPVPGGVLCVTAEGQEYPCQAGSASVSIGPASGSARIAYSPSPGSTITAVARKIDIAADFVPGGAGDSIVISQCSTAGDPVFAGVTTVPAPLTFAGSAASSGRIEVTCRAPAAAGAGQLSCAQSLNGAAPTVVSWSVACPSTLVAPSVSYQPPAGALVELRSTNVIGSVDSAFVRATIERDGAGNGDGAATSIGNCTVSGDFDVQVPGTVIGAEGDAGATGQVIVSCIAGNVDQSGGLSCTENRGGAIVTRQWSLLCPAGRPDPLFSSGFDEP